MVQIFYCQFFAFMGGEESFLSNTLYINSTFSVSCLLTFPEGKTVFFCKAYYIEK